MITGLLYKLKFPMLSRRAVAEQVPLQNAMMSQHVCTQCIGHTRSMQITS